LVVLVRCSELLLGVGDEFKGYFVWETFEEIGIDAAEFGFLKEEGGELGVCLVCAEF